MRDLLRAGADWLNGKIGSVASHAIQYRRTGNGALQIPASTGQSVFEESSGEARVYVKTETRDYLIQASLLVFNSALSEPLRGDVIADGGILYEVIAPANEPHFRYSDPDRKTLRIHTKEIGHDA